MSPEALSQLLACTSVPRAVLTHDDRLSMPANVFEELLAGSFFVLHTTASHVLCHCGEAGSLPVRPPNYPNGTLRFFVACRGVWPCGNREITACAVAGRSAATGAGIEPINHVRQYGGDP